MTTASRPLATALWGARFAGDWLPSCYTTWGDTTPGIAETVDFAHIKGHYYQSHKRLNPSGVVPIGPLMALDAPHGRDAL